VLHRPHPHDKRHRVRGISRLVTLPDWQGLGLAFALTDRVAAAYNALGYEVHMYPAHPSLIRSYDRSAAWALKQRPGVFKTRIRQSDGEFKTGTYYEHWRPAMRPNAIFRYCGERLDHETALALIESKPHAVR
jgi:GNAT superfamily N-acetyltransferase